MLSCPGGHCSGGISSAVDSLQTGDERLLYELKAAQQKADSAEEKLKLALADLSKMRYIIILFRFI